MNYWPSTIFAVSAMLLAWYGMMAVHELGHVIGTYATGGTVVRVVLEPLAISHTDYGLLPRPGIAVWSGPILGTLLPLTLIPVGKLGQFFAGFCLVANGAYLGVGSWDGVGDCGLILLTGSPMWTMWVFGAVTLPAGLLLWHRLGSPLDFLKRPTSVPAACSALAVLAVVVLLLAMLPR